MAGETQQLQYAWSKNEPGIIFTDRGEAEDCADGAPLYVRRVTYGPWEPAGATE
jgi:hypothetical protein